MCKKKQLKYCPSRIDECMHWVGRLNNERLKVLACCCGHGVYPMTIVVRNHLGHTWDLVSNMMIRRKRKFYKRDKNGYYYIPEVV